MKAKLLLLNFIRIGLNTFWYLNFIFIAVAIYFLSSEYIKQDTYYFNEKITINMHKALHEQEPISGSEAVSNIKLFKNGGRIMMNVNNSTLNTFASFIAFLLLETIIICVLFYLRKIFSSFREGTTFSSENVSSFKILALCISLYSPLNWGFYLYKDWVLTQNVVDYNYSFSLDWIPNITGLLVGAAVFGMANIFKRAFEIEQENKEFI